MNSDKRQSNNSENDPPRYSLRYSPVNPVDPTLMNGLLTPEQKAVKDSEVLAQLMALHQFPINGAGPRILQPVQAAPHQAHQINLLDQGVQPQAPSADLQSLYQQMLLQIPIGDLLKSQPIAPEPILQPVAQYPALWNLPNQQQFAQPMPFQSVPQASLQGLMNRQDHRAQGAQPQALPVNQGALSEARIYQLLLQNLLAQMNPIVINEEAEVAPIAPVQPRALQVPQEAPVVQENFLERFMELKNRQGSYENRSAGIYAAIDHQLDQIAQIFGGHQEELEEDQMPDAPRAPDAQRAQVHDHQGDYLGMMEEEETLESE